jgi:hypothetical protein
MLLGSTHLYLLFFLSFYLSLLRVVNYVTLQGFLSKSEFYTSVIFEDNSNTHIKLEVSLALCLIKQYPLKTYLRVLLSTTQERGTWESRWNSKHSNFNHCVYCIVVLCVLLSFYVYLSYYVSIYFLP